MNLGGSSHSSPAPGDARPVYFDREGRRLAGWYHPPAVPAGQQRDCLVLLCNPTGYDAICTHRHYRHLALKLARAGFAVLRYDHHGTGDSSGSDDHPQRIPAWIRGIARALEYGRQVSGARRASIFGVRLGGTLALAAAATEASAATVDSVVAWAPFSSGSLYLREMRALRMLRESQGGSATLVGEPEGDIGEESGGYLLTPASIQALGELDLTALATADNLGGRPVLLLQRDDIPHNEKLARHLRKIGCPVDTSDVGGYGAMMRDTYDAQVPEAALDQVRDWLIARHPVQAGAAAPPPPAWPEAGVQMDADGGRAVVRETPLRFGPHGNLFGIACGPQDDAARRGDAAVVFVNTGSNHHIGPNRMYVAHSRLLAAHGVLALRLDIGGVGESPPAPGQRENHLFANHTIAEVHAAIAHLRARHGVARVVLVGLCSGAYMAFRGAVAEPAVDAIVMINPQNFTWREGDSLEMKRRKGIRSMRFYRGRMLDAATWKRVLKGEVDTRWIVRGMTELVRKRLASRLGALAPARKVPLEQLQFSDDVLGIFKGLLERQVRVFMLFSANDGGLDELETHLGANGSRLARSRHFRFDVVEGADHTFTPLWAQRRLGALLVEHVARLYG